MSYVFLVISTLRLEPTFNFRRFGLAKAHSIRAVISPGFSEPAFQLEAALRFAIHPHRRAISHSPDGDRHDASPSDSDIDSPPGGSAPAESLFLHKKKYSAR